MSETEKLLPCPFCGGEAERFVCEETDNRGGEVIGCKVCQSSTRVFFGEMNGLTEAWNRRAHLAKRDVVEVPIEFIRGFNTLAHNYSLKAEFPDDYYFGTVKDAFAEAYRRCGVDLAKLAAMLRAAQEGK